MPIKITVPFDSLSVAEEYAKKDRQFKETFEVRLPNGLVAERVVHKVRSGQDSLRWMGKSYPIQGEGYNRFITIC